MKTTVPIYIEMHPDRVYAQALFDNVVNVTAATLERALQSLQTQLLTHWQSLAVESDQRELAFWLSTPEFAFERLTVRVRHQGQQHAGQVLLVRYEALGRTLVFTPRWPFRHFELTTDDSLAERAGQVFSAWLKESETQSPPELHRLLPTENLHPRIRTLELEWQPVSARKVASERDIAALGGNDEEFDGGTELGKVATAVLARERAVEREMESAALGARLEHTEKRAVLLLGPSGVGKTTLLHEWLATRATGPLGPHVWHIAPQRVISGMPYLGQWEARWLAILRFAAARNLVLYFDDLLGLFSAGLSAGSTLNMGDLLLPWVAARRVRVLGEITPEAWRVLRERRRAFADQFFVLNVAPPPPAATWRIVANLLREMEQRFDVRFDLDSIPMALALADRYFAQRAFPGRIADVLRTLSARSVGQSLTRAAVIAEFVRRTGSAASIVDLDQPLTRAEIEATLRAQLKGQQQAISALGDVLLRAKAGLNDPGRPLATMLLLGPTGVGKTACAKALATYLGGAGALIRIDLNQYAELGDAARLVGTFAAPDGLLTAAIRRQPCSVVLFDEIEKAAPDVFDVLLSLLDEGRLTDAHGRVALFQQAVIVMTSNLGAREASGQLGFARTTHDSATYEDAARRFFRPEFFNRIDYVLPFAPLSDAELRAITELSIGEALTRSGIRTRQCLIDIDPAAIDALMASGRDASLGARALKRGIERALVQPLARALAASRFDAPTRVRLVVANGELTLDAAPITYARRLPSSEYAKQGEPGYSDELRRISQRLTEIDGVLETHPGRGGVSLDGIDPQQAHYAVCREQLRIVADLLERAARPPPRSGAKRLPRTRDHLHQYIGQVSGKSVLNARADLDRHELAWLDEARLAPLPSLSALARESAWLEALLADSKPATHQLQIRAVTARQRSEAQALAISLASAFARLVGCQEARVVDHDVQLSGFALAPLLAAESGYWLRRDEGLALIEVSGGAAAREIIRVSRGHRHADVRHGLEIDTLEDAESLRRFVLQGLLR